MSAKTALEEMLQLIQRRAFDIAALPVDRRRGSMRPSMKRAAEHRCKSAKPLTRPLVPQPG